MPVRETELKIKLSFLQVKPALELIKSCLARDVFRFAITRYTRKLCSWQSVGKYQKRFHHWNTANQRVLVFGIERKKQAYFFSHTYFMSSALLLVFKGEQKYIKELNANNLLPFKFTMW